MPTYTYECPEHGQFDALMPIRQMRTTMPCPECGYISKNIITLGKGGIRRNDSSWIRETSKQFEMDGHRPMHTIEDLRQFYKENPTIKRGDSHPALPSSVGDIQRPVSKQERFAKMKKQAMEFIRRDNTLTVNSRKSA
uniref:Putative regulatory protein FmdB zinc ribbon domain-containing protein n=1 Tax=viral metagenome TaxID=1070528 RepID=A0A6M3IFI0_9ZZZZ